MSIITDAVRLLLPLYGLKFSFISAKAMSRGASAADYLLGSNKADPTDYYVKESTGTVVDPTGMLAEFGIKNGSVISPDDFRKLCGGINPRTGEPLLKNHGDAHRAGTDFAFSPPKSISALWALLGPEGRAVIEAINRKAFEKGFKVLADHAVTRRGAQGKIMESAGIVAVQFQHGANRNSDPHLHLHNPILNLTKGEDGQWRTLETRPLFQWRAAADAAYQAELISQLQKEFGLQIQVTENGHSFEIVGVPDALLDQWSSRRGDMKSAAAEAGVEVDDVAGMDRMFYRTRQKKDMLDDPHSLWAGQAEALGFSTAEAEALANGQPGRVLQPLSQIEINQEVGMAIDRLLELNSTVSEVDLHRAIAEQFFGKLDADGIDKVMQQIKTGEIQLEQMDKIVRIGSNAGLDHYTTQSMIQTELRLQDLSKKLGHDGKHKLKRSLVEAAIADQPILSQEQADLVRYLTAGGSVKIGEGSAGVGKTTLMKAALAAHVAAGYQPIGAAATWKAAGFLERDTGLKSRALAGLVKDLAKGKIKLTEISVVLVDEAGMVGSRDMERLVTEIDRAGAKLLLIGDTKQLNSTAAGPALEIMVEEAGSQTVETIRRQRKESHRQMVADMRDGKSDAALKVLEKEDLLSFHKTESTTRSAMIRAWEEETRKNPSKSSLLIAVKNSDVDHLNRAAREILRKRGEISGPDIEIETATAMENFAKGDEIFLTQNDNELGVKNKDRAKVLDITKSPAGGLDVRVQHEDGRQLTLNSRQYEAKEGGMPIRHAYAVTQYASQGATVDTTFVLSTGMDRRYAYVALSRHKEQTRLFVDESQLAKRIKEQGLPVDRDSIKLELATQLNRKSHKMSTLDFQTDRLEKRMQAAAVERRDLIERMKKPAPSALDGLMKQLHSVDQAAQQELAKATAQAEAERLAREAAAADEEAKAAKPTTTLRIK